MRKIKNQRTKRQRGVSKKYAVHDSLLEGLSEALERKSFLSLSPGKG
jgi:hypothetical protein